MDKDKKPKRQEKLTTTIGDLLKSQGNNILETEKKPYKKNNKKYNNNKDFKNRIKDKLINPNSTNTNIRDTTLRMAVDRAVEKGILKNDDTVKIEPEKPITEEDLEVKDGNWEEFTKAFTEEIPEKEEVKPNIKINADYISFDNSDKRIKTDTYKK